jgi:hypothetical protein
MATVTDNEFEGKCLLCLKVRKLTYYDNIPACKDCVKREERRRQNDPGRSAK